MGRNCGNEEPISQAINPPVSSRRKKATTIGKLCSSSYSIFDLQTLQQQSLPRVRLCFFMVKYHPKRIEHVDRTGSSLTLSCCTQNILIPLSHIQSLSPALTFPRALLLQNRLTGPDLESWRLCCGIFKETLRKKPRLTWA